MRCIPSVNGRAKGLKSEVGGDISDEGHGNASHSQRECLELRVHCIRKLSSLQNSPPNFMESSKAFSNRNLLTGDLYNNVENS